ncbi:hypothetical protein DFH09DRAFT_1139088 [Mycena vulgaris]|nr:hypothetical protein DFH09DRAFT_1139088 [Mycena vulgaris]
MYPDGRINPTPVHFARNTPVEIHPPVSSRLLHQRHLDREGRAICRIVYASGLGVQVIAKIFCVSEDTIIQAIENNSSHEEHDKREHDYFYVSSEYRNRYPSLPMGEQRLGTSKYGGTKASDVDSAHRNGQSKVSNPGRNGVSRSLLATSISGPLCQRRPPDIATDSSGGMTPTRQLEPESGPNPTCRHFRENLPVARIGGLNPQLDRKGRAICRIMHPYLRNYTKIGLIFGVTHKRIRKAVLNDCSTPDDVAEDYEYAGREFQDEYPPLSSKPASRASESASEKRQRSPELDEISKRAKKNEMTSQPATRVSRMMPVVEVPARKLDPGAVGIGSFLKNVGGFDLSQWQETFKKKGLPSMGDLSTLACLDEERLVKTLTKLFADQMAEVHILLLADALLDLARDVAPK